MTAANTVVAATDGSALGNPGPSGWSWWASSTSWDAGTDGRGTNNAAELKALAELLGAIPGGLPLQVRCDSMYVCNIVVGSGGRPPWRLSWARKNWRTKDGPVANLELVQLIDARWRARIAPASMVWVRAHQSGGDPFNAAADAHARAASESFAARRVACGGPGWTGS